MLAAAVVSRFLLPALQDGAGAIAGAIADKVGEQAAAHTEGLIGKLWERVDRAFGGAGEREQRTLEDFKEDPETYEDAVTKILQRRLDADPALAEDLQKLLDEPVPGTGMTGAQVWNAGVVGIVDARQARFTNVDSVNLTGAVVSDQAASRAVPPAPQEPPRPSGG